MEALTLTHLYVAYEEENLNSDLCEVTLFKEFKWQPPCSALLCSFSLIIALLIVNKPEKASAFVAIVETSEFATLHWKIPPEESNANQSIAGNLYPQSQVEVLFCKISLPWKGDICLVSGIVKGSHYFSYDQQELNTGIFLPRKSWIFKHYLCDYDSKTPVKRCGRQTPVEGENNLINRHFCSDEIKYLAEELTTYCNSGDNINN